MDSTPDAKAGTVARRSRWPAILVRIACILVVGWLVGNATSALEAYTSRQPGRSGFGRGVLHGVLMPFALPNLIVGQNVAIYQPDNTGRPYNLGYTLGVNSCGNERDRRDERACFFGQSNLFFASLWKK